MKRSSAQNKRDVSHSDKDIPGLIGTSPRMKQVFKLIREAAQSNLPVLIIGAPGTGKETMATAIHQHSKFAKGPFIVVDCAAIRPEFLPMEFFGHRNGTDPNQPSLEGKVEMADRGTLFIKEVESLPEPFQGELLRFLRDFTFRRVEGKMQRKVEFRLIAALNGDVEELILRGLLRNDLYQWLKGLTLELPALKDRGVDIWLMAKALLKKYAAKEAKKILGFSEQAKKTILTYDWPGNINELDSCIRRAVVMAEKPWISLKDLGLPSTMAPSAINIGLEKVMAQFEEHLVATTFFRAGGNVARAARELKISQSTMRNLLKKYSIFGEQSHGAPRSN